ncbi:MAG: integration host factor subunit beta [Alcanivorax sp.]|jgi:integration host factor subunit beta|uniref:Integration host factor subunit beta n=1 Tax=Alloalcanivorax venustensis ISO4 TaxID=1177184 RepID=A0ABS0AJF2_9GAMM|nr:integration host factor subunit beta [Alloalcanivorax venustensis]MAD71014.1 integration host factor subunit beta [Alcanivorax sp.]MCH9782891.1 integration host factor subunit beta [Gammaproteobacteria bacterium]MED5601184.1 integration host factor subunit beta [Pseudomonadota bacterium]MAQ35235.1 integration host factor subunit beta [Alcanivorax sp.]MBA4730420.1 integration host factor subunit beta [Alcanivorax sp.]|tara:strand:- start:1112 stop:1483 length:372 start_codon:yes stop_codon:yes gene_type:complete
MASALTKSKLIARISKENQQLSPRDVELAVKTLIDYMADTLAEGGRIEIRGFGSFSLHFRAPRVGRNPKTGASVKLHGKYVPHFKSGKELRERVNDSMFDASSGTHGDEKRNADDAPGEAVNG